MPPHGGLAKITVFFCPANLVIASKQSPASQKILFATPYISALCLAHFNVLGSFSIAKTRSQRPERAKAIALPPTPANASMITVFSFGADSEMCAAILLELVSDLLGLSEGSYVLCDGLWGNTKPGIFCHPYTFIVLVPDLVPLKPISNNS